MLLPRGGPRASLLDRLYETASPEWLDDDDLASPRKREVMKGLERFNRATFAYAFIVRWTLGAIPVEAAVPRILELGAGHGELSLRLQRALAARGRAAHIVASDVSTHFVESMRARLPPAVEVRQLDATRTGLPDGSFDLAVCSLLLHHLPPEAACALLREGTRVARRLLIVDGWRHPAMLAISPLFFAIGNYAAFHDGVISLRKMYGRDALTHMARIAGPQISVDIRFRLPGYLTCVASRNP